MFACSKLKSATAVRLSPLVPDNHFGSSILLMPPRSKKERRPLHTHSRKCPQPARPGSSCPAQLCRGVGSRRLPRTVFLARRSSYVTIVATNSSHHHAGASCNRDVTTMVTAPGLCVRQHDERGSRPQLHHRWPEVVQREVEPLRVVVVRGRLPCRTEDRIRPSANRGRTWCPPSRERTCRCDHPWFLSTLAV